MAGSVGCFKLPCQSVARRRLRRLDNNGHQDGERHEITHNGLFDTKHP